MKLAIASSLMALTVLAACASNPTAPAGMKAGQFVTYSCDAGKRFQARLADDGRSVRIRAEGGYELDHQGAGVYEAEGWKLVTQGDAGLELAHNGKVTHKACKPQ